MSSSQSGNRMPVVFAGHGSPVNAIEDNPWSRGFAELADCVPKPRSIVAVSAHWYVDGTCVMTNASPRTIHDFGGFPQPLYEIEYPASGDTDLATRVVALLDEQHARPRTDWGLDHGTWSVLRWMYPSADVPVIQLSIDRRRPAPYHWEIGRALAPLRDEGVLILASGNVVHNLRDAFSRMQSGSTETPEWALRFDADASHALEQHDRHALETLADSSNGRHAHPTPDHWLPLLYAAGASDDHDRIRFTSEGFDVGSLSMRNVIFG